MAAVVELGYEACERLSYLDSIAPSSITGVLASGQIPNSDAAIANLCPKFEAQQRTAKSGFGDGEFRVHGAPSNLPRVKVGTYVAVMPTEQCSWQLLDHDKKVLATGGSELGSNATENKERIFMRVESSAATVISSGCYAWLPKD